MSKNTDQVFRWYQTPALSAHKTSETLQKLQSICSSICDLDTEHCIYVQLRGSSLSAEEKARLDWLFKPTLETRLSSESRLLSKLDGHLSLEYGPRFTFSTPYSTNAISICSAIGLAGRIVRIERSTIYRLKFKDNETSISKKQEEQLGEVLHDRMTEQRYEKPVTSFELQVESRPWITVDVMNKGRQALKDISDEMGLSFDDWDLDYYTNLFRNVLKRNPTSVECFDLAQSNSEHSRHWFFKGLLEIDGQEYPHSLIELVANTQKHSAQNNVIKFNDNSSAIRGFQNLQVLRPTDPTKSSELKLKKDAYRHILFTAETHNFPTGVAPFQGATTGPGGRIRDVQAAGQGAHVIAGTAGYSVGNLHLPGYNLPWERREANEQHPSDFARPADILIQASNGASDYGNKFGEPLISGFCRSFGQRVPEGERIEYIKPIMFSAGIGSIDAQYVVKGQAELGMHLVKVGGPVYRIGVGGGAASSVQVQGGEENAQLNFNAVQRGDPEMEHKMNRVIRGCIENDENPIHAIHDQGAGGNGNVLKEIADPKGAAVYTDRFTLGDPTINTLELWGAEYQESNALLVHERHLPLLKSLGQRERCQVDVVGEINETGRIQLIEPEHLRTSDQHPVDLNLEHVLGSMPPKLFRMKRIERVSRPMQLPSNLTVQLALQQVLRLPSVCSKRFLTNKVDRSVTGLVAQQQCIGPLHTPLADYAAIALSPWNVAGSATAIGEQPIKGLICPRAGGEMSVAEMITNLMFACISDLKDVKCSGNWMWAAKLPGEGTRLVETCETMCNRLSQLNVAIDGGKDSLSMAAVLRRSAPAAPELIKSPGTLVLSGYAPMPDIRRKVTPLLSSGSMPTRLLYIPLHSSQQQWNTHAPRLGGSALSQTLGQLGDFSPRMEDARYLKSGFQLVQDFIKRGWCLAGHDVSDGGLLTAVLEMAFASDCGLQLQLQPEDFGWDEYTDNWKLNSQETPSRKASVHSIGSSVSSSITTNAILSLLFNEEVGVVIEVLEKHVVEVEEKLSAVDLACISIGKHTPNEKRIRVLVADQCVLDGDVYFWRDVWEETSYQLELLQADRECVKSERALMRDGTRHVPNWKVTFEANHLPKLLPVDRPTTFTAAERVAVLREEGTNGDREMAAALFEAGFQVMDVTTSDLIEGRFDLKQVNGLVFPGGFSFADVLGSARGWAASVTFNKRVSEQLAEFKARPDTWSLGVCNGCQLMALIGWVGSDDQNNQGTQLQHNRSERYESRFTSVKIQNSNSVLLKEMNGTVMGVWIAHGEGRFVFKTNDVLERLRSRNLIALSYVDDDNQETVEYPMNPNGSELGIAGICSEDGRHLAMMPHPERCTQLWQWPYIPPQLAHLQVSPWRKMFRNAFDWATSQSDH